jgi:hypothetical protein
MDRPVKISLLDVEGNVSNFPRSEGGNVQVFGHLQLSGVSCYTGDSVLVFVALEVIMAVCKRLDVVHALQDNKTTFLVERQLVALRCNSSAERVGRRVVDKSMNPVTFNSVYVRKEPVHTLLPAADLRRSQSVHKLNLRAIPPINQIRA